MRLASGGDGKEDSNPTLALHSTVPGPELTALPVRNCGIRHSFLSRLQGHICTAIGLRIKRTPP